MTGEARSAVGRARESGQDLISTSVAGFLVRIFRLSLSIQSTILQNPIPTTLFVPQVRGLSTGGR